MKSKWAVAGMLMAVLVGSPRALLAAPGTDSLPPSMGPSARSNLLSGIAASMERRAALTESQRKISSRLLPELRRRSRTGAADGEIDSPQVECNIKCTVTDRLASLVEAAGGTIVSKSERFGAIHAFVPAGALETIAADPGVRAVRQVIPSVVNKTNTSEGGVAHKAASARSSYGVTGKGVTVGVMSDSVRYLEDMQNSGDLPSDVNVLDGQSGVSGDGDTGEGTAMLEIVHDLAPGAGLMFATGWGTVEEMAENILALARNGCRVIVDDVTKLGEPFFGDSPINEAIDEVTADGTVFFTSAGNFYSCDSDLARTWEGDYAPSGATSSSDDGSVNYEIHSFGDVGWINPFASSDGLAEPGKFVKVVLQWSDRFGASGNDYDLYLIDGNTGDVITSSEDIQSGNGDPLEFISIVATNLIGRNPAIIVVKEESAAPRFLHLYCSEPLAAVTPGSSMGHNAAANAISLAATPTVTNKPFPASHPAEDYSCDGPRKAFYDAKGNLLSGTSLLSDGGVSLQKPDFAAADRVSCATPHPDGRFYCFGGTSASAPHAAAIAALMLEACPELGRDDIFGMMRRGTFSGTGATWDSKRGFGILDAEECVRLAAASNPYFIYPVPAAPLPRVSGTTLSWGEASGANWYRVYKAENPYADPEPYGDWQTGTAKTIEKPSAEGKAFFWFVKAARTADEATASGFSSTRVVTGDSSQTYLPYSDRHTCTACDDRSEFHLYGSSAINATPYSGITVFFAGTSVKFRKTGGGSDIKVAVNSTDVAGGSATLSGVAGLANSTKMAVSAAANSSATPRAYAFASDAKWPSGYTTPEADFGKKYIEWHARPHYIYQAGQFALSADTASQAAAASGATNFVAVTATPCSAEWTASVDKDWVHLYRTNCNGSALLGYIVEANGEAARTATITLRQGGTAWAEVAVSQDGGSSPPPPSPTVTALVLTGPSEVAAGAVAQYECQADWTEGPRTTVTDTATWSVVSGDAYGAVAPGGRFTAYSTSTGGDVVLQAAYGGQTATKTVRVAAAVPVDPPGWSYTVSNGMATITRGPSNGDVVIPSVLGGCPVTAIGYHAFRIGLTGVTIPDGVTIIGYGAFENCTNLTRVTIPDSVTDIRGSAFEDCIGLTSLTIPAGVTNIGSYAFSGCSGLTSVAIPDGVTDIGDATFKDCSGLNSVTIPDGVTHIGDSAFCGCSGLNSMTIPDGVTSINNGTFSGCSGLTRMTIPNNVTNIGSDAFAYCSGLRSVTVPTSVTNIEWHAFDGCNNLTAVYIHDMVAWLNITFETATSNPLYYAKNLYLSGEKVVNLTIPGTVTDIRPHVFRGCSSLTRAVIPNSVTNIAKWAFSECGGLTNITIPDSVISIGNSAFWKCTALRNIAIPPSVTDIEDYVFHTCSSLTNVVISPGVKSIGVQAFAYSGLTSVAIPNSVTNIDYWAFEECPRLASVLIADSVTHIGREAFHNCSGLTNMVIPDSVVAIGEQTFDSCSRLKTLSVPGVWYGTTMFAKTGVPEGCAVTYRGLSSDTMDGATWNYVIRDNAAIVLKGEYSGDVSIPGTLGGCRVTCVGNDAFASSGLTSVTIPDSVTSIGDSAFRGCSGLTSVTIPDGVTSIGDYAFRGCSGLTSVAIPDGVTSIGDYAFSNCTGLKGVALPGSLTSIADSLFVGCTGLTDMTIPDNVTNIGRHAFYGCNGLTSVTVPDSVRFVGTGSFTNCPNLKWLCVPPAWEGTRMLRDADVPEDCTIVYLAYRETKTAAANGLMWLYGVENGDATVIGANPAKGNLVVPSALEGAPVTGIGTNAFAGCTNLVSISLPICVEEIEESAFHGCDGLAAITVAAGCENYSSEDGLLYSSALDELVRCPPGRSGAVVLADNALSIGDSAFRDCTQVTSVLLGDEMMYIGNRAFSGCVSLSEMTVPDHVVEIGESSFSGCTGLVSVALGNAVAHIGPAAFSNCPGLGMLELPDSVETISDRAFSGCTGLQSVLLGNRVEHIGNEAFASCTALTAMTLPEGVAYIGTNSLNACRELYVAGSWLGTDKLSAAGLPAEAQVFYDEWGCVLSDAMVRLSAVSASKAQGSVAVPPAIGIYPVTGIGAEVFAGAEGLTAVDIPAGVAEIGESAFLNCTNLMAVGIHDVGAWCGIAFGNSAANPLSCAGRLVLDGEELSELAVPAGVPEVGAYAFYGCGGLASASVPAEVGSIGHHAFYQCTNLAAVAVGDAGTATTAPQGGAGTDIGDYAFYHCTGLKTLTLGNNVRSIGAHAFRACSSLAEATIPPGVTNVGNSAFYLCGGLKTLYVPAAWEGTQMLSAARVPAGCRIVYYDPAERAETTSTPVAVPFSWLAGDAAEILAAHGGDHEAAAAAKAANGMPVWACYVAGLSPTDAEAEFKVKTFSAAGGTVRIEWDPDLNENGTKTNRTYAIQGKQSMDDEWDAQTPSSRFFRVKVSLP